MPAPPIIRIESGYFQNSTNELEMYFYNPQDYRNTLKLLQDSTGNTYPIKIRIYHYGYNDNREITFATNADYSSITANNSYVNWLYIKLNSVNNSIASGASLGGGALPLTIEASGNVAIAANATSNVVPFVVVAANANNTGGNTYLSLQTNPSLWEGYVKTAAAGGRHTILVANASGANIYPFTMGNNSSYQLGRTASGANDLNYPTMTDVYNQGDNATPDGGIISVYATKDTTMYLASTFGWSGYTMWWAGNNYYYQVGTTSPSYSQQFRYSQYWKYLPTTQIPVGGPRNLIGIKTDDNVGYARPGVTGYNMGGIFGNNYFGDYSYYQSPVFVTGGTTVYTSSPVQISGGATGYWNYIDAGSVDTSIGIANNGTLHVWGNIAYYAAGFNTSSGTYTSPTQWTQALTGSTSSFTMVTSARAHNVFFAIDTAGSLFTWGYRPTLSGFGQTYGGVATTQYPTTALQTIGKPFGPAITGMLQIRHPDGRSWSSITTSSYNAYAIDSLGYLYGWGRTNLSQLGKAPSSPFYLGTTSWSQLTVNSGIALGIKTDGTLWSWGMDLSTNQNQSTGRFGLSYYMTAAAGGLPLQSPTQIGSDSWTLVRSGQYYCLGIKSDGSLWGWGKPTKGGAALSTGAFGPNNATTTYFTPTLIDSTPWSWIEVDSGGSAITGVKADGTLWAWGIAGPVNNNTARSTGVHLLKQPVSNNTNTTGSLVNYTSSPVQIGTANTWSKSYTDGNIGLAISSNGSLWTWGNPFVVGNGLGSFIPTSDPVQVDTGPFSKLSIGTSSTILALQTDGTLKGWGGLTANATLKDISSTFTWKQAVSMSTWISQPNRAQFALDTNGRLFYTGDISITAAESLYTGYLVSSPRSFTMISAGKAHLLAVATDGTLWGVGNNYYNAITSDSNIAAYNGEVRYFHQINANTNWSAVAGGDGYSMGLKTDGTLWGWGYNVSGRIGTGGSGNLLYSPTQVGTANTWTKISAGTNHTAAIRADGSLWTWGYNFYGALGDGTIVDRSSPVQIGTSSWTMVSAGAGFTAAITVDGKLFTWGFNNVGQLGSGTVANRSSPVQVGTDTTWYLVDASITGGPYGNQNYHAMLAAKTDGTVWVWGYSDSNRPLGQFNTTYVSRSSPVQVSAYPGGVSDPKLTVTAPTSWAQVSIRGNQPMVIDSVGNMWTYGNGTGVNTPAKVGSLISGAPFLLPAVNPTIETLSVANTWYDVHMNVDTALGIKPNGTLWAWGADSVGQMGIPARKGIRTSSPVQVGTDTTWTSIVDVRHQSFSVVAKSNTHFGMGYVDYNAYPMLFGSNVYSTASYHTTSDTNATGIASFVTYFSSPVQVGTYMLYQHRPHLISNTRFRSVATTANSAAIDTTGVLAVARTGELYAWGDNSNGALGVSDVAYRSSIVQVGSSNTWLAVYGGGQSNTNNTGAVAFGIKSS